MKIQKIINIKLISFSFTIMSIGPLVFADNLTDHQREVINEYHSVMNKRRTIGYFKGAGEDLMRAHQHNVANHLAVKLNIQNCNDLKKYIPKLESGVYFFSSKDKKQVTGQYCESNEEKNIINSSILLL